MTCWLDRATRCWPWLSPAVTLDSVSVRHRGAKAKASGVKSRHLFMQVVFVQVFLSFFPPFPIALCSFLAPLAESVAVPAILGAPAASGKEPRGSQSPACCSAGPHSPVCAPRGHLGGQVTAQGTCFRPHVPRMGIPQRTVHTLSHISTCITKLFSRPG